MLIKYSPFFRFRNGQTVYDKVIRGDAIKNFEDSKEMQFLLFEKMCYVEGYEFVTKIKM